MTDLTMELLEQLMREPIAQILRDLPVARRLEGLSAKQILASLSPQVREALAQRLKTERSPRNPE